MGVYHFRESGVRGGALEEQQSHGLDISGLDREEKHGHRDVGGVGVSTASQQQSDRRLHHLIPDSNTESNASSGGFITNAYC